MKRISPLKMVLPVALLSLLILLPMSAQDASGGAGAPEPLATVAQVGSRGPTLRFPFNPAFEPVGSYSFSIRVGDEWQSIGAIEADAHMRPREIDLSKWVTGTTLELRVERTGGGMAHVDAFLVNGQPPITEDARLAMKLGGLDYDVLDDSEVTGEWVFDVDPGMPAMLQFTGRIEPSDPTKVPFLYPLANIYGEIGSDSEFYGYTIGSRSGHFTIDGVVEEESLGDPLFAEWFQVGTGHPQGSTFGWVADDGESLYVAIDFTADNSIDGEVDYAAVYVNTPDGVREFKVSIVEEDWGKAAFAYTSQVDWEHKTYEFAIPITELGVAAGQELQLAFAAYGTSGPPLGWHGSEPVGGVDPNGVEPNTGTSGTTFTFLVEYIDYTGELPQNAQVWIDIDGDGQIDQPGVAAWLPVLGVPNSPVGPAPFALIALGVAVLGVVALVLIKKRRVVGIGIVVVFAVALSSCGARIGVELFNMEHTGGTPGLGADFSADIIVTADPGTYNFRFVFTTGPTVNTVIPDNDTGIWGPASGWMSFDITP